MIRDDYHDCNRNPLWYHILLRPLIRKREILQTFEYIDEREGIHIPSRYFIYWARRNWYNKLWNTIDSIKQWIKNDT